MELLHQLGEFVLQAVPTAIVVFLFYVFLKANFFRPLEKVMAQRSERIDGARKQAEAGQAAAQEKFRTYQEALKKARAEVYAEQEAARRAVLEERSALLRDTRNRANEKIRAAKENIAGEIAAARGQLEQDT
ncbi:MAG TPA: ATP synthase F0 subunit B, partial [Candidatus Acidoferrales bacterium]|nr:ATP synthase F0 subunit B [Candidatus Acidoferrales bacterium]